ncbi:hypothetical protein, partial [Streptomyces sp. NPDC005568]|uniref:hypothetical protein n=1 Tax=Streptomyces sp. NPDC005568 TaxID=3156887 RepID=UPI0033A950E7
SRSIFPSAKGPAVTFSLRRAPSLKGRQHVAIDMPKGLSFTSIEFDQQGNVPVHKLLTWVDNFSFSAQAASQVFDRPALQELVGDTAYYGGAGNDVFSVADVKYFDGAGAGVHGGAGTDTLKLTGAGQTLDISKLLNVGGHDKITSIEVIDITGTGNNTLKLSMRDVLELGHENVFRNDGHTQLMVNGNAGDRVELSGMPGLTRAIGAQVADVRGWRRCWPELGDERRRRREQHARPAVAADELGEVARARDARQSRPRPAAGRPGGVRVRPDRGPDAAKFAALATWLESVLAEQAATDRGCCDCPGLRNRAGGVHAGMDRPPPPACRPRTRRPYRNRRGHCLGG